MNLALRKDDKNAVRNLSTLLLPISKQILLVPNVNVAEILDHAEPHIEDDMPTWYMGMLIWRTLKVPLISFEGLNEQPFFDPSQQARVAIFNGLQATERMPFWGLVTQGTPRQMRVQPDEIRENTDAVLGPAEKMSVFVNGESAIIPDLDFLEQQILALNVV